MTKMLALQLFAAALLTGTAAAVASPHLGRQERNVKALGIFIGALGEIRTPDPQIRS